MENWSVDGVVLVAGVARGELMWSDTPLSFWGGIDPASGIVIDRSHPLHGRSVAGKILALPSGRGSCTGSSVMMQLLLNDLAPSAMLFAEQEEILSLGVIVAEEVFGRSIPMVNLGPSAFAAIRAAREIAVDGGQVGIGGPAPSVDVGACPSAAPPELVLTLADRARMEAAPDKAVRAAMRIIVRMAGLLGAGQLIDVTRAHIDGCIYTGPASLQFAELLRDWGGRVAVPTTLNAISVDQQHWRRQGTDPALANPASALADAYVAMGARPTFTCAPYLADSVPGQGEDIAWAESNAVVYANSVLGARTMKYPDYLDICIALTGRAPQSGCHLDINRKPTIRIAVDDIPGHDDSFYPLLGYHIGKLAPNAIPLVTGLEAARPSRDDLKAFGAAFGTTSAAPMFHILGVTPEAADTPGMPEMTVTRADLSESWRQLNTAESTRIDLVSLGNPHFSHSEAKRLAELCRGRSRHPDVAIVVTLGRTVHSQILRDGIDRDLAEFGVRFVLDTCWCMIGEPVIPLHARTIITNSGKYAHYGPGLSGRDLRFGSLGDCVDAACTGVARDEPPGWL
jgi:predicted aconitase/predicted aconitase with swiveling domain